MWVWPQVPVGGPSSSSSPWTPPPTQPGPPPSSGCKKTPGGWGEEGGEGGERRAVAWWKRPPGRGRDTPKGSWVRTHIWGLSRLRAPTCAWMRDRARRQGPSNRAPYRRGSPIAVSRDSIAFNRLRGPQRTSRCLAGPTPCPSFPWFLAVSLVNFNRRRTNVQQLTCKIDSFNSFYYLFLSFIILELKSLVLKGKVRGEKWWKSAKKCEKVRKIMKRFCPLVVAL